MAFIDNDDHDENLFSRKKWIFFKQNAFFCRKHILVGGTLYTVTENSINFPFIGQFDGKPLEKVGQ